MRARGLVREAREVERGEQPVARAVAGEDAAGPVAAVRCRREAEDVELRARVAEARDRPAPVGLGGEGGALLARDLLAPGHEPRAAAAARDAVFELGQRRARIEPGAQPEQLTVVAAQAFSFRPLVNSHCDQRYAGTAS